MFKPSTTRQPVIFDAEPSVYHATQSDARGTPGYVMSRGELRKFASCPRKWLRGTRTQVSGAMKWGSIIDTLVLTPDLFMGQFAVTPPDYQTSGMQCPGCGTVTDSKKCRDCKLDRVETVVTKPWSANSATCNEWMEAQKASGKTIISPDLLEEARIAKARLLEDEEIKSIIEGSRKQVAVNVDWHDETTGIVVPFKCLLDIVPDPDGDHGDTLYDLKTTDDANGIKWPRTVFNFGLHYQAACYLDALNAAGGFKYRNFGHVISESEPPYEPTHRLLAQEFIDLGRDRYQTNLRFYCWCLANNTWPGYDTAVTEMEAWMLKD